MSKQENDPQLQGLEAPASQHSSPPKPKRSRLWRFFRGGEDRLREGGIALEAPIAG